ncbi:hypothetical protein KEM52_003570, partial [Ascosphaera acerosa]
MPISKSKSMSKRQRQGGLAMREACRLALERLPAGHHALPFDRPVYAGDQSDPGLYATACFRDLNRLLFRGVLSLKQGEMQGEETGGSDGDHPNTILRWAEPDGANLGYTRFGYTSRPGVDDARCVVITLNEHAKRLGNWGGDILAALLHQMVHAYFVVSCGGGGGAGCGEYKEAEGGGKEADGLGLTHGLDYCALLYRVQDVLRVTYAAYTDLFRCLPLQHDHLAVHDVPPYVAGRSCCDWMGIHRPSDDEIERYI